MATVFDVAAYVLRKQGRMTTMKLQKLVYYSQAWSLAWGSGPLFPEPTEAWKQGPVVRALWEMRRGCREIDLADLPAHPSEALTEEQQSDIDAVLGAYARLSAERLSSSTHQETPWLEARQADDSVISLDAMAAYFSARDPFGLPAHIEGAFLAKTLLARCHGEDPHGEWDWGPPVGQEAW